MSTKRRVDVSPYDVSGDPFGEATVGDVLKKKENKGIEQQGEGGKQEGRAGEGGGAKGDNEEQRAAVEKAAEGAVTDPVVAGKIDQVRQALANTEGTAKWLDRKGILRVFGLDQLLGTLIPGGDILMSLAGLKIVWEAHKAGMPKWDLIKMAANIGIDVAPDFLISWIPFVGSVIGYAWDATWRSNVRNRNIMKEHLRKLRRQAGVEMLYPEEVTDI